MVKGAAKNALDMVRVRSDIGIAIQRCNKAWLRSKKTTYTKDTIDGIQEATSELVRLDKRMKLEVRLFADEMRG